MKTAVALMIICLGLGGTFCSGKDVTTNGVKLMSGVGVAGDGFGSALSLSSNRLAVADFDRVFLFDKEGGSWIVKSQLQRPDLNSPFSVALGGDTLAIGSLGDEVNVFARTGTNWLLEANIANPDPDYGYWFGASMALGGDTLVITDPWGEIFDPVDDTKSYKGVGFVFERTGGLWSPSATLTADTFSYGSGRSCVAAIYRDFLVLGYGTADGESVAGNDTMEGYGAAYFYARNGGTWSRIQKLVAPQRQLSSGFGGAVGIHSNLLVVGAAGMHVNGVTNAGAAYVYKTDGTAWLYDAMLTASTKVENGAFGNSVAVWGDRIAVGSMEWQRTAARYMSSSKAPTLGSRRRFSLPIHLPRTPSSVSLWP